MTAFNDFVHKYKLKKATSIIKLQLALDSIRLNNVGIYSGGGPFSSDVGKDNSDPSKETHWVRSKNENFFDSYGVVCPKKLSKFMIKQNVYCFHSDYQI